MYAKIFFEYRRAWLLFPLYTFAFILKILIQLAQVEAYLWESSRVHVSHLTNFASWQLEGKGRHMV
jgi:hypothetical protein